MGTQPISLVYDLVMGCPNARAGVEIVTKKEPLEQPSETQILTLSLVATSGGVVGVALVVPILVGKPCLHWKGEGGVHSDLK